MNIARDIAPRFSPLFWVLFVIAFSYDTAAQGRIVYTSNITGNNEIWRMDPDGSRKTRITSNTSNDSYPNLSGDGRKIAFVSDRDGNPEIYVMSSVGAFQTRLTDHTASDQEPIFSPDGSKIAFSSNRNGNYDVYIMNADGTNLLQLTSSVLDEGQPAFSHDGSRLLFVRLDGSESHIHSINTDGTDPVQITTGSFTLNGQPTMSSDGQKIVFSSIRFPHGDAEVYIMNANGTAQTRLTTANGQDLEPVFSPDGTKIAFRSERDGNPEIYLMNADGSAQTPITTGDAGVNNFAPSWGTIPSVTVSVPTGITASLGTSILIPIDVSDTTGMDIVSFDFVFQFNNDVLFPAIDPIETSGTLSSEFEVNAGSVDGGVLAVSGFGTTPLTGSGTLLYIRLNVIGTPPSFSGLSFNSIFFNEGLPLVNDVPGTLFVLGTISGTVFYGNSAASVPVSEVLLSLSPGSSTATTASNGTYTLFGLGIGNYRVTPTKSGDVNGISALDASLISRFLVGSETLSPNQQLAGDVSGNGVLTSFDAALIAQYVVGIPNESLTGTWKFNPPYRDYVFETSLNNENYDALLMGEVSGNWMPSGGFSGLRRSSKAIEKHVDQAETEQPEVAILFLPYANTKVGQPVNIPIRMKSSGGTVQAYQFDLIYDPAVIQPEMPVSNSGGTLSSGLSVVANPSFPGRLKIAVYGANSFNSSGVLLNLNFRAVGRVGQDTELRLDSVMFNEGSPLSYGLGGRVAIRR